MVRSDKKMRVWHYSIDSEGRLWHEGTEITDPQVLKFFMRRMEKLPDGSYQVMCQGEKNLITAEDVPYVVQAIKLHPDKVELIFPGEYVEILDPETLSVGKDNILYCKIRNRSFNARFNRKPYLELAQKVEFDSENKAYYLPLNDRDYLIRGVVKK